MNTYKFCCEKKLQEIVTIFFAKYFVLNIFRNKFCRKYLRIL